MRVPSAARITPATVEEEQHLRRVLEVGVERIGRRRRQPVGEPVPGQHPGGDDR